jgi:hypothetical protein
MAVLPHDTADLYLPIVVLAADARIEELGLLNTADLTFEIALEGDTADWTPELRETGLLRVIEHDVDTHGWQLSMDERGVRLTHHQHTLVLGLSKNLRAYLSGS